MSWKSALLVFGRTAALVVSPNLTPRYCLFSTGRTGREAAIGGLAASVAENRLHKGAARLHSMRFAHAIWLESQSGVLHLPVFPLFVSALESGPFTGLSLMPTIAP
jgi:hypothetical protein